MPGPDDTPDRLWLACGHVEKGGPDGLTFQRVVRAGNAWTVETLGSWCVDCVAQGKAPEGLTWGDAWNEVERGGPKRQLDGPLPPHKVPPVRRRRAS